MIKYYILYIYNITINKYFNILYYNMEIFWHKRYFLTFFKLNCMVLSADDVRISAKKLGDTL